MSDTFYNANEGEQKKKKKPSSTKLNRQIKPPVQIITNEPKDFSTIWKGINNETVYAVMELTEPIVTIATISLYRYRHILRTLDYNPNITKTPLNICLRIQAAEEMPVKHKNQIVQLLETKYRNYDLQFTYKNHGSGVPRHDVVHRALDYFNSKFIMTLDDDIVLPKNAIDVLAAILIDHPDLGSITLSCINSLIWTEQNKRLLPSRPKPPFCYSDAVGSGTTMVRKEVFQTCDLDPNYYIGWADMDFGKQVKLAGWKQGVLTVKGFQANNPPDYPPEYRKVRHNSHHTEASWRRYKTKWGMEIKR
jgi:hypothetical protein